MSYRVAMRIILPRRLGLGDGLVWTGIVLFLPETGSDRTDQGSRGMMLNVSSRSCSIRD
jgi:hypothetical protein